MLGQAGGRSTVCLERVALNWIETSYADEEGRLPPTGRIEPQGEAAFFSDLPLEEWKEKLGVLNLPVTISLNAGGYVCNALYFSASRALAQEGRPLHLCFIHVPYLPEQTIDKKNVVAMEFEKMQEVLKNIIKWCLEK